MMSEGEIAKDDNVQITPRYRDSRCFVGQKILCVIYGYLLRAVFSFTPECAKVVFYYSSSTRFVPEIATSSTYSLDPHVVHAFFGSCRRILLAIT